MKELKVELVVRIHLALLSNAHQIGNVSFDAVTFKTYA